MELEDWVRPDARGRSDHLVDGDDDLRADASVFLSGVQGIAALFEGIGSAVLSFWFRVSKRRSAFTFETLKLWNLHYYSFAGSAGS